MSDSTDTDRNGDLGDASNEDVIKCWCGAEGAYEELFNDGFLDRTCGGTESLNCYCGGDQCVCHHHGTTDCPGCRDCQFDDDDDDDDRDDFWDEEDDGP